METSLNGTVWTVVAEGRGDGSDTEIAFKPIQAKFIKLTQTAATDNAPPWSIADLRVLEQQKTAAK